MWYGPKNQFLPETTMPNLLEVTLADGRELDVPALAVAMFEEVAEGTMPNLPNTKTKMFYGMGQKICSAFMIDKFDDLVFELGINTAGPTKWLRLTKKTGGRICLLSANVVGRMGLEEGCEVSYLVGNEVQAVEVTQTRRQIKKWSEEGEGRPDGLMEIPVPEGNQ